VVGISEGRQLITKFRAEVFCFSMVPESLDSITTLFQGFGWVHDEKVWMVVQVAWNIGSDHITREIHVSIGKIWARALDFICCVWSIEIPRGL
jgi:hypothetical protein